jgi:hypothetical protein
MLQGFSSFRAWLGIQYIFNPAEAGLDAGLVAVKLCEDGSSPAWHEEKNPFREELCRLREEGKVCCIGLSTHNRNLAGRLAAEGAADIVMICYNAAHCGAEQDIFPHLKEHDPVVISYTATRWRYLLKRLRKWPKSEAIPTAGMCYRFILSNSLELIWITSCWAWVEKNKRVRIHLNITEEMTLFFIENL